MPFPFSIQYKRPLRAVITPDNQLQVLQYIEKRILEKLADNVVIEANEVSYKGTTGPVRQSLFGSVDKGTFTFVDKGGRSFLRYEVRMHHVSTVSTIIGVVFLIIVLVAGNLSQTWLLSIVGFLWLSCGNGLISWFRHEDLLFRIAIGVDETLGFKDKEEHTEQKEGSEKLKSWL
jgi:hypothetical protein